MMKDEELSIYLIELDKLQFNYITLKNKNQNLSNKGFNEFEYNNKIKDD